MRVTSFSNSSTVGIANLHEPSFFFTSNTGEENRLVLGQIIPLASISPTSFSISNFWKWRYCYGLTFTGAEPGRRGMRWSWSRSGGMPVGVENIAAYLLKKAWSLLRTTIGVLEPYFKFRFESLPIDSTIS